MQHFRHDVPLLAEYYAPEPTSKFVEPIAIMSHPDIETTGPDSWTIWRMNRMAKKASPVVKIQREDQNDVMTENLRVDQEDEETSQKVTFTDEATAAGPCVGLRNCNGVEELTKAKVNADVDVDQIDEMDKSTGENVPPSVRQEMTTITDEVEAESRPMMRSVNNKKKYRKR